MIEKISRLNNLFMKNFCKIRISKYISICISSVMIVEKF